MESLKRLLVQPWTRPLVWLLCLLPLLWLWWQAASGAYVNPEEALVRGAGDWALRMLCLTLAVTPLRVTFSLPQLLRFRRVFGLSVFLYASVHLLLYVWLQMGFSLSELLADVADRAFILMGMLAYALLLPLALTSNNAAIRRLGGANWQALHRIIYLAAGFAIVHFLWMRGSKNDVLEVWIYALILTALLGWRLWYWNRGSSGGSCGHH